MATEDVGGAELLSKVLESSHGEQLLEVLTMALHEVMEAEVDALCGAGYGERSGDRRVQRNGYRQRPFETRLGSVPLSIPRLRKGSYLPSFVSPRRRWEQAFVNVVCEAYVHGVSTRKVEALIEAMGAKAISKSEVSRIAGELDEQVDAFRTRPLDGQTPYLWLDALYIKVRSRGRVVSKAVLVAYGVGETGQREVLGLEVADGEMETAWRAFLAGLVQRGLSGVQLVVSDAHSGLRAAIRHVLNGTTWQRCTVHFLRNVLSHVQKAAQPLVSATVRTIFQQPTLPAAQEAMGRAIELLDDKCPKVAELLREAEHDVLAFMHFPDKHWRQIKSTNPLERLNKEIRRRTDVVGIFPTEPAVIRLVGALLAEQNDEWAVGRRYFSIESMKPLFEDHNPHAIETVA
ncbi:MAG: IS256 family transposase [Myxococcales bacterium]|nr:IS256 family transposase [Myxococcales bacterium]